jgi:hypothetical protein
MGPYIVFVPISNDTEEQPNIMVLRGTNDAVLYIMGSSRCLWEDMRPIVCVEDQDNDGAVDQLYYSIYKDGFADELQVVDQDFDGQADSRFRIRTGEDVVIWLWVEDGWYEKVKGGRLVLVNGAETPYRLSNGKYVFGGEEEQ